MTKKQRVPKLSRLQGCGAGSSVSPTQIAAFFLVGHQPGCHWVSISIRECDYNAKKIATALGLPETIIYRTETLRLCSQHKRASEADLLHLLGGDAVTGDMLYAIIGPHELVDQHGVQAPAASSSDSQEVYGSIYSCQYFRLRPVGQASACHAAAGFDLLGLGGSDHKPSPFASAGVHGTVRDPPDDWPWKKCCGARHAKGIDCSNFSGWNYNWALGIHLNTDIHKQAARGQARSSHGELQAHVIERPDQGCQRPRDSVWHPPAPIPDGQLVSHELRPCPPLGEVM